MAGLAALDPARDARACRARSHRRHRTHRTPTTRRSDRPNLQRDPTSLHQIDHRTHPADHRSAGLVALATTPSTPRPCQPLPPARNSAHVITIYGWGTKTSANRERTLSRHQLVSLLRDLVHQASVGAGPPRPGLCVQDLLRAQSLCGQAGDTLTAY